MSAHLNSLFNKIPIHPYAFPFQDSNNSAITTPDKAPFGYEIQNPAEINRSIGAYKPYSLQSLLLLSAIYPYIFRPTPTHWLCMPIHSGCFRIFRMGYFIKIQNPAPTKRPVWSMLVNVNKIQAPDSIEHGIFFA
jgi:hypothetical protein